MKNAKKSARREKEAVRKLDDIEWRMRKGR